MVYWGFGFSAQISNTNTNKRIKLDCTMLGKTSYYMQWKEDKDPLPVNELLEWDSKKPQPQVDLNDLKLKESQESCLRAMGKSKRVWTFVKVSGNPAEEEAETLTSGWQTGLWNRHIYYD